MYPYMCIKEPTGWFEEWHGIPLVASTGCIEIRANEMLELKLERHSADLGQRVGGVKVMDARV